MSTDGLARRIKSDVGYIPTSEAMYEAAIFRISKEEKVSIEEATEIYESLLVRIHKALHKS